MPKPPPTSGAWSWMRSSGSLKTNSASWRRMPCRPCPVSSSSSVSVAASYRAIPARGSMGVTTTRLFITSISTTCAACFIACATTAASPLFRWKARLPGASSQIAGAPAASAATPSTTAGSGS